MSRPCARPFERLFRRRPGLRARLVLLNAAAVAIAIVAVSLLAWWTMAETMHRQVDKGLESGPLSTKMLRTEELAGLPLSTRLEQLCDASPALATLLQPGGGSVELVRADGSFCTMANAPSVPVTASDVAAATSGRTTGPRTTETATGVPVRAITLPVSAGYSVMIWRDLTEVNSTLRSLSLALLVIGSLGALIALSLGWLVARAGLRPLDNLTGAAEHVAATQRLNIPISVTGDDEVARLARAFNKMTTALDAARHRHNQMIADASHELRTPLTSLRTNVELLVRSDERARELPPADRRELLDSLTGQVRELSHLAGELSLLAHEEPAVEAVPVRLDVIAGRAVERAGRRGRHTIRTDLRPWTVIGDASALERAILNVLDNAVKFSPPESTVTVRLRHGLLEVADEGPGIPPGERAQVFQRFWRSPTARAMPGSGLGLAIVTDVVDRHGGQAEAGAAPTGGAVITIRLPGH